MREREREREIDREREIERGRERERNTISSINRGLHGMKRITIKCYNFEIQEPL